MYPRHGTGHAHEVVTNRPQTWHARPTNGSLEFTVHGGVTIDYRP